MTEIKNQLFHSLVDEGYALSITASAYLECEFSNCILSLTKDLGRRSTVSDVILKDCTVSASDIGPAILRRVTIDGLTTDSLFIVWGAVFDQVVFRGRIGKIKINRYVHPVDRSEMTQKPFDDFRSEFYQRVEWALDISHARFRALEINGIPARLIRRDPSTQMVVTRDRVLRPDWRSRLSPGNTHWPFVIDMFLATNEEDQVLVAPLTGPKKQTDKLLRDLLELRELGIVE